ncbi:MAG: hypothetical protein ACRD41_08430, partial [Candidatus Acidiferrales bacterium]
MKIFFRVFLAAVALFIALPSYPAPAHPATSGEYAIEGAKIFTLAGPSIENGTVLIEDGKISAVGANVTVPASAQVIDA